MKTGKETLRAALYPVAAASLVLFSQQGFAAAPTTGNFDQWSVTSGTVSATCPPGFTCGTIVTGDGFFQRQITDSTSGGKTYFQTIVTDTGATNTPTTLQPTDIIIALTCPTGFMCGSVIVGDTFLQQEYTDGTNFWFQTIATNLPPPGSPLIHLNGIYNYSTPLYLFHTQSGLILKPGHYLVANAGNTLADQPANLHLNRDKLTTDAEYLNLNQQSEEAQKIYHQVVDAEISGVTSGGSTQLSAQLNVPLEVPSGYELHPRVLTSQGWIDFVNDDHNRISAAAKLDTGYCPTPGSDLYKNDFGASSECIQVTIQDGGPNDGDGATDGKIALTTGVILKAVEVASVTSPVNTQSAENPSTSGNPTASEGTGGGGVWPWWLSLAAAGLLFRHNKRQRRAV